MSAAHGETGSRAGTLESAATQIDQLLDRMQQDAARTDPWAISWAAPWAALENGGLLKMVRTHEMRHPDE